MWKTVHKLSPFPNGLTIKRCVNLHFLIWKICTELSKIAFWGKLLHCHGKVFFPHSLERQKVNLALKIFNDTNIAALKSVSSSQSNFVSLEGTTLFLEIISVGGGKMLTYSISIWVEIKGNLMPLRFFHVMTLNSVGCQKCLFASNFGLRDTNCPKMAFCLKTHILR